MPSDPQEDAPAPPDAADLARLGADAWAVLLPRLRAVLAATRADDPEVGELITAPVSRLVGGRLHRRVVELLHSDGSLWAAVIAGLPEPGELPRDLAGLLVTDRDDPGATPSQGEDGDDTGEHHRLRRRLRRAREQRDVWRRRAEGAEARAASLQAELADRDAEVAALSERLEERTAALEQAAADRERAVARTRRRRESELERLQEQLTDARRELDEQRAAVRRADDVGASSEPARSERPPAADGRGSSRFVPGRPSHLPDEVAPGTTEAARLLLHRGRLVLVDGYNVTKTQRPSLDLEAQRAWLVQAAARLVAQHGVEPVVVFDGERAGGSRLPGARGVRVRFTDPGVTADDEIVLAVEGTDHPVVVVTDDRELVDRVEVLGADVVGTRPFVGMIG